MMDDGACTVIPSTPWLNFAFAESAMAPGGMLRAVLVVLPPAPDHDRLVADLDRQLVTVHPRDVGTGQRTRLPR